MNNKFPKNTQAFHALLACVAMEYGKVPVKITATADGKEPLGFEVFPEEDFLKNTQEYIEEKKQEIRTEYELFAEEIKKR